jgi:hypothetical protein
MIRDDIGRFVAGHSRINIPWEKNRLHLVNESNKLRYKLYWKGVKSNVPMINAKLAWCLGIIASDAYVCEKSRQIKFHCKDKEILYKIKAIVKMGGIVHKTKHGYWIYSVGNWLYLLCMKYGIKGNKTYNLRWPTFEKKHLYRHFIRGFFDGDGGISSLSHKVAKKNYSLASPIRSDFTCASLMFIRKLAVFMHNEIGLKKAVVHNLGNYSRIYFAHNDSIKMCKYLYKNCNSASFLERKHGVVHSYLN